MIQTLVKKSHTKNNLKLREINALFSLPIFSEKIEDERIINRLEIVMEITLCTQHYEGPSLNAMNLSRKQKLCDIESITPM